MADTLLLQYNQAKELLARADLPARQVLWAYTVVSNTSLADNIFPLHRCQDGAYQGGPANRDDESPHLLHAVLVAHKQQLLLSFWRRRSDRGGDFVGGPDGLLSAYDFGRSHAETAWGLSPQRTALFSAGVRLLRALAQSATVDALAASVSVTLPELCVKLPGAPAEPKEKLSLWSRVLGGFVPGAAPLRCLCAPLAYSQRAICVSIEQSAGLHEVVFEEMDVPTPSRFSYHIPIACKLHVMLQPGREVSGPAQLAFLPPIQLDQFNWKRLSSALKLRNVEEDQAEALAQCELAANRRYFSDSSALPVTLAADLFQKQAATGSTDLYEDPWTLLGPDGFAQVTVCRGKLAWHNHDFKTFPARVGGWVCRLSPIMQMVQPARRSHGAVTVMPAESQAEPEVQVVDASAAE